jgi:alcohol dehydrogenase
VRIQFGAGSLERLPEILRSENCHRVIVIADPVVLTLDRVSHAFVGLAAEFEVEVLTVPEGEPTLESVDALGALLREANADVVVAIGGGSALDSAKGARLLLENPGSIRLYTWPGEPQPVLAPTIPLITIPTTAGTGSEVTGGVVMTDEQQDAKVAAPSPLNRAQYCLVDPELTLSLPPSPSLWGGLDALGQAIGSVVSKAHTPVGDGLGLEAIRLAVSALPRVMDDLSDIDARSDMACAALLAGLAMNVSEAGTEHSLAHPLGSIHHLPHGLTVGMMLAESMEHDIQYEPERFERVADAMGAPKDGTTDGTRAVRAVRELLAKLRCATLADHGITEADVEALTECALAGWVPVEPGPWSADDVRAAYGRALLITR